MNMPKIKLELKLLIFFVVTSILPLLTVNAVWFRTSQQQVVKTMNTALHAEATDATKDIDDFVNEKIFHLSIHTHSQAVHSQHIEDVNVELSHLVDQDKDILSIGLYDTTGKPLTILTPKIVLSPAALAQVPLLSNSAAILAHPQKSYVSDIYFNGTDTPMLDITIPVTAHADTVIGEGEMDMNSTDASIGRPVDEEAEEVLSIIHATVSVSSLWNELDTLHIGQNGFVYVRHTDGRILTHADSPLLSNGEPKKKILNTHVMATTVPWEAIAVVPEADILRSSQPVMIFVVILIATLLGFIVVGGLWIDGKIVKPIKQLQRATTSFANGDFGFRTNIRSGDELENLGNTFNTMAGNLQEAIAHLETDKNVISAERNKLAVLVSGMSDAVIAVDMQRRVLLFNKTAEKLTGLSEQEAIGQPLERVMTLREKDQHLPVTVYCPVTKNTFEGIIFTKKALTLLDASGEEHVVDVVASHIAEGRSVNLGCILTLYDVSKEQLIERIKNEFVSIAAHQLRTPLTAIKWSLEALLEDIQGMPPKEQRELLNKVNMSNERMIRLVNDLLDVARIEEGRFAYHPVEYPFGRLVETMCSNFSEAAKRKKVTLTLEPLPTDLPLIHIDVPACSSVIQNLLENAVKYTPSGGTITVTCLYSTEGDGVELRVHDTGVGIPPAEQQRVFTKFFRGENVMKMDTEGSGLGLFMCKNIIEAHRGQIWFESIVGKGTTFYMSLPLKQKKITAHTTTVAPKRKKTKKRRTTKENKK